jgi:uracil-DNA glycosylase family 4
VTFRGPPQDCALCPRLADFRQDNRKDRPKYFNAPVPAFGALDAALLIVGLAPGLHGANRTGRPFTGDFAGDLLYPTLARFGWTRGTYARTADDGFALVDCRVTNAVRCVPPANKPTTREIATCRDFLAAEMAAMARLRVVLALGRIAHDSVLSALGERRAACPFAHGAVHALGGERRLVLADSYHCSRYNTNTGRLTTDMFESVVRRVTDHLRS